MNNLFELENKYLTAKVMYYKGTPIMTDPEFDAFEAHLKSLGSKVPNQVGAKNKDFDFTHPTPMLSLGKVQTEANEDGTVNFMTVDFLKWYGKRAGIIGNDVELESSPKYDGNAINTIYVGGKLTNIVTRGDGVAGKDVTNKLEKHFPTVLNLSGVEITDTDVVEIRSEVVIDVNFWNGKYSDNFANPRNYVAGVLSPDEVDEVKCSELMIMPLHLVLNGEHITLDNLINHKELMSNIYTTKFHASDYEKIVVFYIELRKKFHVQLDGIVISLPSEFRSELGENSHDPEWALAIKFISEEVITEILDVEWFIGKTGEFTPVVQLKPVQLAGTTVSKASAYNAGYIVDNKIKKGTVVSIVKSGDIIPMIKRIIY